jgi:predicted solute-binding protein
MSHSVTVAKISEHKRKQIELSHRVLKVGASLGKGRGVVYLE